MVGFGIGFAIVIIGVWMAPNADTRMDAIACIGCIIIGSVLAMYALVVG